MGKPSTCAFRCFYDSEKDVCGPSHFCEKVGQHETQNNLAPFGAEQKCKAVGAADHEAADLEISKKLEDIKGSVLDLAEKMEQSEAITEKDSSRSSLKDTVAMFQEAVQMLDVMEALPMRLAPESGDFTRAAERAAYKDMKHWRGRPDRLTIPDYQKAGQASIADVRNLQDFSVQAKLHNTLTDFIKKRPNMLIKFLKQETNDKCSLSDETPEQLGTFVNYFLSVPGYDPADLQGDAHGIPTPCRDYLFKEQNMDVQSAIQAAEEGVNILSNSTGTDSPDGLIQVKSDRLVRALGSDRISLLETGASDFAAEDSEKATIVGLIIGCFLLCLIFCVFIVAFWVVSIKTFGKDCRATGWDGTISPKGLGNCAGSFFFFALGGLIIFGAFALFLPLGIATLVVSVIATGVLASLAQIKEHKSEKPLPNWKAISHLAM